MCLSVPGKLVSVDHSAALPTGKVTFGGVAREICLAYTPEAEVGDYVLVHAGFAISKVDEAEAEEIFSYLNLMSEEPGDDPATTETPAGPNAKAQDEELAR